MGIARIDPSSVTLSLYLIVRSIDSTLISAYIRKTVSIIAMCCNVVLFSPSLVVCMKCTLYKNVIL